MVEWLDQIWAIPGSIEGLVQWWNGDRHNLKSWRWSGGVLVAAVVVCWSSGGCLVLFCVAEVELDFNTKLSDFGLAKASTQVMGTHGYAAPEYVATGTSTALPKYSSLLAFLFSIILLICKGRLSAKSDVYNFGVLLLELLSGHRAIDKSKAAVEQNLVDWAKPYLGDKRKLFRIMDTNLEGQYPKRSLCNCYSCLTVFKHRAQTPTTNGRDLSDARTASSSQKRSQTHPTRASDCF
ncbi:hypothetical protein HYC85_023571 [Camellia sinensis]|uniref:Protein kinase domain-containing protein n=1 Tax=Camellia sinensis TaxID=4442 RepID=A0A7J7GEY5_CAMSI|nr:hypothetical protein HYC85_023571 [Camellia sinensis]